jgi:hypothetical protein
MTHRQGQRAQDSEWQCRIAAPPASGCVVNKVDARLTACTTTCRLPTAWDLDGIRLLALMELPLKDDRPATDLPLAMGPQPELLALGHKAVRCILSVSRC